MRFKAIFTLLVGFYIIASMFSFVQAQNQADALMALDKQEFKRALEILGKLESVSPKDPSIDYLKGKVYVAMENSPSALASFNRGISNGPKYAFNYIGLGALKLKENNLEEGKKNLDKALELTQSANVPVLIAVSEAYIEAGMLKEPEPLLTKAKLLDNKNAEIYIALGDIYMTQKIYELALNNYKKAIELDPKFMKGYLRVGQLYVRDGKYNEGADAFKQALAVDPLFAPVSKELGELYYKAKKYETAKENYKKYVELTQNDISARIRYASFLYLTGDYQESIDNFEACMKDTTTNVMLRLLGYNYYEIANYVKAKENLDKYFASIKPENILASDYEYYAKTLDKMGGNEAAAIENYEKAMAKDSSKFLLNADIATIYKKAKNYEKAEEKYKLIVSRSAGYKELYDLGMVYYYQKKYPEALEQFEKMKALKPDLYLAYFWAGSCKAASENSEQPEGLASEDYQKVVDILKSNPDKYKKDYIRANAYLAYVTFTKEDYATSKGYCETVLAIDPENAQCKQMMEFISKSQK